MMQLQRRNFGLSGTVFFDPDSAYDNLFNGTERKKKKDFKKLKKETKRSNKINNMNRRQDKKDSRQTRRNLNNDKRQIRNDMKTAKVEEKKVKTSVIGAPGTDNTNPGDALPPKKSDNTMIYVAAGVGVVLLAAGAFMIMKKPQVQNAPRLQPVGLPRA